MTGEIMVVIPYFHPCNVVVIITIGIFFITVVVGVGMSI